MDGIPLKVLVAQLDSEYNVGSSVDLCGSNILTFIQALKEYFQFSHFLSFMESYTVTQLAIKQSMKAKDQSLQRSKFLFCFQSLLNSHLQ